MVYCIKIEPDSSSLRIFYEDKNNYYDESLEDNKFIMIPSSQDYFN